MTSSVVGNQIGLVENTHRAPLVCRNFTTEWYIGYIIQLSEGTLISAVPSISAGPLRGERDWGRWCNDSSVLSSLCCGAAVNKGREPGRERQDRRETKHGTRNLNTSPDSSGNAP